MKMWFAGNLPQTNQGFIATNAVTVNVMMDLLTPAKLVNFDHFQNMG